MLSFINITPESNDFNLNNFVIVINRINYPNIPHPEAKTTFQLSTQPFDVVILKRIFVQFGEGEIKTSSR